MSFGDDISRVNQLGGYQCLAKSAGDLFGMVSSRGPFKGLSDLQRLGMKRSRLESPGG